MTSFGYDGLNDGLANDTINLSTDTFYVMLVGSGYTPDKAADVYRSAVTANEVTGTGYTAGGQAVTVTRAKDTTNHKETITFSSVTWPSSTISAVRAVYYKHRGGAASADELLAQDDFGGTVSSTNGTFTLNATTITLNTAV